MTFFTDAIGGVSFPELPAFRFLADEEDEAGTDEVEDSELGGDEIDADAGLLL